MNPLLQSFYNISEYRKSGEFNRAVEEIEKVLPADSYNTALLAIFAIVSIERGADLKGVKNILMNIVESEFLRRGKESIISGDKNEGADFYHAAADTQVIDEEPYNRLADIYRLGHHAKLPLECYATPIGIYILPDNAPNDVIMKQMKAGRVFDKMVFEESLRHIQEGTIVVDVGANFGQMSMLFSKAVGELGKVIAIEAQKYVCDIMKMSIDVNYITNIDIVNIAALNNSDGFATFHVPDFSIYPSYGSYGVDLSQSDGPKVKKMKIDDLEINSKVSFMKIDIQGADLLAMQGARKTIEKHRMPIIFEHEKEFDGKFGTSLHDYMKFIDEIGYYVDKIIGGNNYLIVPKK